jgi:hypothetical protein
MQLKDGAFVAITRDESLAVLDSLDPWVASGHLVVALALLRPSLPSASSSASAVVEYGVCFVGAVGFFDQLNSTARSFISKSLDAGLKVIATFEAPPRYAAQLSMRLGLLQPGANLPRFHGSGSSSSSSNNVGDERWRVDNTTGLIASQD